jgi:uncharacterized protein YcbX
MTADADGAASAEFTLARAAKPGTFFDFGALHVVTTSTLARLTALHPQSTWDARRFRPNLLVDDGALGDEPIETGWLGRDLLIGPDVRVRVATPTSRCIVVTLAQQELERDATVLRAVATHNRHQVPGGGRKACVGVYAEVVAPGTVRVGDHVEVGDPVGSTPGLVARALAAS